MDGPAEPTAAVGLPLNGEPARSRGAVVFLTILLGSMAAMGPLSIDMYLPAFLSIAKEFSTDVSAIQRTLAAYFVGLALGQLFYGPAADRYGRKPPLYVGLVLFIAASIGCALARNAGELTALRFMQALGGCAEMVVARAIVRDLFAPQQAARVFASLMLVMGLAPILAPLLGGWIVVHLSWRAIFWFLAGFGTLVLLTCMFCLRESLPVQRRLRESPREILGQYAMLLRHRVFIVNSFAGGLVLAGLFAYVGGSPYVFMDLFHVPEERFGIYFGANAAGLILASQVGGMLVHRFDMRVILRSALATAATAGTVLLFMAMTHTGGFAGILIPLFFFVASLGFVFPTTTALAMAPHGRVAGSASAVMGCVQFLVSGAGGILVSVLQKRYMGSAVPMAALIAAGGVSALMMNLLFLPRDPVVHTATVIDDEEVAAADVHA